MPLYSFPAPDTTPTSFSRNILGLPPPSSPPPRAGFRVNGCVYVFVGEDAGEACAVMLRLPCKRWTAGAKKNSLLFATSARAALLRKRASDTSSAACRAAQLLLRSAVPGVGAGAGAGAG